MEISYCEIQRLPTYILGRAKTDRMGLVIRCTITCEERRETKQGLKDKVAIVTGTGRLRGIGHYTALSLAKAEASVAITGTGLSDLCQRRETA